MKRKEKFILPQLTIYGTAQQITQASGDSGAVDTLYVSTGYFSFSMSGKGSSDWGTDPCADVQSGSCP